MMDWQTIAALVIVAVAAISLVRNLLARRKHPAACDQCSLVQKPKHPNEHVS